MTKPPDPRFAKVVARMRSTTFEGERDAARVQAGKIAARAGMTLDEALKFYDQPVKPQPAANNPFAGFDDWMEAKEPGWKAQRAAERADKLRAWAARRAAIIARFGSAQAAWAPCWREKLILDAVAPWRKANDHPGPFYRRWTVELDGWKGSGFEWRKAPAHIIDAIRNAYPMPTTFAGAKAEWDYWAVRNREMEDALSEDGSYLGDTALDRAADVRAEMVRSLAETELPLNTLADIHARFAIMLEGQNHREDMEKALFRDLTRMMEREAPPSAPGRSDPRILGSEISAEIQAEFHPSILNGQIADALRSNPDRSDRAIARATGCSPTTVGKVRRDLGLGRDARSVQRNGQTFRMKPARKGSAQSAHPKGYAQSADPSPALETSNARL